MAAPQDAPLPPFYELGDGMKIRVTAVDATTGATVSGVVVSDVSFSVDPDSNDAPTPSPSPLTGAYTEGGPAV